ncbi:MAG: hypothetical protein IJ262_06350 [Clostridia bacterium]|nr:hypothetical protein [Clostridia bacterium]
MGEAYNVLQKILDVYKQVIEAIMKVFDSFKTAFGGEEAEDGEAAEA